MRSIIQFFIDRPLVANLLFIVLVVIGLSTMITNRRETFPSVDYDIVIIHTLYPGASADKVETLVTYPMERALKEVDGIKKIDSGSSDSVSEIAVWLDPNYRDKDGAIESIRNAVDQITDLPEEAEDPLVIELTSRLTPVKSVAIFGEVPYAMLHQTADRLEDVLLGIPGVARVIQKGYFDPEIEVRVDPERLRAETISLEEIASALRQHNVSIPGGSISRDGKEFFIKMDSLVYAPEEVGAIVIRANDQGHLTRIRDVAQVVGGFEDPKILTRTNGKSSINLQVLKKERGDTLRVAEEIDNALAAFEKQLPDGVHTTVFADFSNFVRMRLGTAMGNGILGMILVLVSLFVFLSFRVALFTAIGIPVSIFITFIGMAYYGITINMVSLVGFVMVLGMLVDDAIIVGENIYQHLERGVPPMKAAVDGTLEVLVPVTGVVLTTFAAFGPLMFMEGIMGKFIWAIPAVVIMSLGISLMEAFILLPSHIHEAVRRKPPETNQRERWLGPFRKAYLRLLERVIQKRYFVLGGVVVLFFATIFYASRVMPFEFFPSEDVEIFFAKMKAPPGTSLAQMRVWMEDVEKLVLTLPEDEFESAVTDVGLIQQDRDDPFTLRGDHYGQIRVTLTPKRDRRRSAQKIIEEMREKTKNITRFEYLIFSMIQPGPPVGKPIQAQVMGDDLKMLERWSDQIQEYLRGINGVRDVTDDFELGRPELRVNVDAGKAYSAGLSMAGIGRTIRTAFEGDVATTIQRGDVAVDVRVSLQEGAKKKSGVLEHLLIPNRYGNLTPLSAVASVSHHQGPISISHLDGKRVIAVTANVEGTTITANAVNQMVQNEFEKRISAESGISLKLGGEWEDTQESLGSLFRAMGIAALIILFILTVTFNSFGLPLMVMSAIPFGAMGVIWAFAAHGKALGFLPIMGIVALSGVVVNDSLVLVTFIKRARARGMKILEAILEAGARRFRAVILTSVTTLLGLFPSAYGLVGDDPFLQLLTLAIGWGLFFATGLTLFVIPSIYHVYDDILAFFHNAHHAKQ